MRTGSATAAKEVMQGQTNRRMAATPGATRDNEKGISGRLRGGRRPDQADCLLMRAFFSAM